MVKTGAEISKTMTFQPLTSDLVGSAFRLSTQAGWNQTSQDWERLSRLNSVHSGVWVEGGEVRASYSLIAYGNQVVWIGMILVDQGYRGAGLGKTTFCQALEHAKTLGFKQLGLDATHLGEPIYAKVGFETICPIVRWQGMLSSSDFSGDDREIHLGLTPAVLDWDSRQVGIDRSTLLRDFEAGSATILRCENDGRPSGFAVIRPGRTAQHLGPVVAESETDLTKLLSAASPLVLGQNVICDVLSPEIEGTLFKCGLRPSRHLKRMILPPSEVNLCGPAVRCAAGFEFG